MHRCFVCLSITFTFCCQLLSVTSKGTRRSRVLPYHGIAYTIPGLKTQTYTRATLHRCQTIKRHTTFKTIGNIYWSLEKWQLFLLIRSNKGHIQWRSPAIPTSTPLTAGSSSRRWRRGSSTPGCRASGGWTWIRLGISSLTNIAVLPHPVDQVCNRILSAG